MAKRKLQVRWLCRRPQRHQKRKKAEQEVQEVRRNRNLSQGVGDVG